MTPRVSVCMATFRKRDILDGVLNTIFNEQAPPFPFEVIVVDDGSDDGTHEMAAKYPIVYDRIDRGPVYRNPGAARNRAMRLARADILVLQSDDVRHVSPACERLAAIEPGTFNIATVYNVVPGVCVGMMYTGPQNRRPLFFLGSVRRSDICAVGGNDEEFVRPGWEDDWLAACLTRGRGLRPVYRADVTGYHQDHPRPDLGADYAAGRALYEAKARAAETGAGPWTAAAGPWPEPINTSAYVPVTI